MQYAAKNVIICPMKRTVLSQPVFMYSIIMIAVLGFAGAYAYTKIHQDQAQKDALVRQAEQLATGHASAEEIAAELADARTTAQKELDRLDLFVNYSSSPEALAAMREDVFQNVLNVFAKNTESVFKDINNSKNQQAINSQNSIQAKIAADQAHIQDILQQWKALVTNPVTNSSPGAAVKASTYATQVQTDVKDLQQLAQQLTPGNSGLTPQQIAADQATIDVAVQQIQQVILDLSQTVVPPAIIQQQQQVVDSTQNQVNNLQQQLIDANNPPDASSNQASPGNVGSGSGGTPPYVPPTINLPGTRYVPPVSVQDPTKPKLIEGANPGL